MNAVAVIAKKRDGGELTREEIAWFVGGFVRGEVTDYQASAWLMAICCRGMTPRETADLTDVMAASGERVDLGALGDRAVDKHSTGGVGDKTTLVVGPMAAACGLVVAKMSGRGLGFTGGTLDKLESIRGLRVGLDRTAFLSQAERIGLVVAGQSAELAPADGLLYALRDVTGTVESIPLIASSIMSKKLAAGSPAICLDVKVGRGAFMKSPDDARALARAMVDIGARLGRRMSALITGMDEPLGNAVGNALEVAEAVRTLQGCGPSDLVELAAAATGELLRLAGRTSDDAAARERALETIRSGAALGKLRAMVEAQGGDVGQIDDPRRLPQAPVVAELPSPRSGYVASVDAEALAWIALELGAGRRRKGDRVDHAVGIVVQAKVGDLVRAGEPLVVVHCRDRSQLEPLADRLVGAFGWSELPVAKQPLVRELVRG
ncbi:MAG TPA: thymidine phosphorylase [Chloroflexota bacterium]|nr:thymidine phosphorylase [Chloroflexota bacterium]